MKKLIKISNAFKGPGGHKPPPFEPISKTTQVFLRKTREQQRKTKMNYYISDSMGDDANLGTTPDDSWETFGPLQAVSSLDGVMVHLHAGDIFPWNLVLDGVSGLRVMKFGTGPRPIVPHVSLTNCHEVRLMSLDIRNSDLGLLVASSSDTLCQDVNFQFCSHYAIQSDGLGVVTLDLVKVVECGGALDGSNFVVGVNCQFGACGVLSEANQQLILDLEAQIEQLQNP